ncbi:MAG: hypothetical protein AB7D39_17625 [Pseudodesulfovibrio sp.]|uniref:hypothetical protein n=1 Tax=Pseudodesulfovibrio sp. TaxID=2035812 RepID=UPI003D0E5938
MKAPAHLLNLSVIKQMRDLTTNPVCTKTKGRVDEVRYETADKIFVARASEDGLPRPSDVPVFWFALEALQAKQNVARDIAEKTGVAFDPRQHMTVKIPVDDILAATDRKIQTNNRKAAIRSLDRYVDTTIEIEYRGDAKRERRKDGRPDRYKFSMISTASHGTVAVEVSFTEQYLEVLDGLCKKEIRYLALDHVVRLSGTASQLYGILAEQLGHKRAGNEYKISARTLARKIFGEDRGGDKKGLPTSRFYAPYVTNALDEISEKTGWKIGSEKVGRGEDTTIVFWTAEIRRDNVENDGDRVPNAFEVARAAVAQRELESAAGRSARCVNVVGTKRVDETPETAKTADTDYQHQLSPEVLAALPDASRNDKAVSDLLAPLSTAEAIALIEHCKRKSPSKPIGYLVGIAKRNNLQTVAAGLSKDAARAEALDGFTSAETATFGRTWRYICNDGDDAIREHCEQGGIDYDRLMSWVDATNKAKG